MTDDTAADPASEDATDGEEQSGVAARIWHRLVAASSWFADTFRGHSGANQFEKREK